jgi:hypothetical protein
MNRILLALATASIFALGCGRAALDHQPAAPAASPAVPAEAKAQSDTKAEEAKEEIAEPAAAATARAPGDFVVYRFSGSTYHKPLTLTQRVVARDGAVVTIDLALVDGDKKDELRVKIDEASPSKNEVVSVARLVGGAEKPATLEAYEAMMLRTTLSADQNEALVGTEDVTVDVGGAAVPAKRTTYRVRVGKKQATLKTLESSAFAWGDVGGEIVTTTGKVLYKAEVVEAGHAGSAAASR